MKPKENVSLASLTTFCLGGPARYLVPVRNIQEVREALSFAKERELKFLILGGGSNVLVGDAGFDGLVVKMELRGIEIEKNTESATLTAWAGEDWDDVVARAIEEDMWGIENLSGIPGTVGAAPVQNIGAYGAELKDTLVWVEVFDTQTDEITRLTNSECGFGYRTSRFKREGGRFVILRAAFNLTSEGKPNDTYKDLADIRGLSLPQIRQKVLAVRKDKFPDLSVEGTAGSFFLNPVVSAAQAEDLLARYPGCPHFPAEGGIKLSLAWLLDKGLGLHGEHVGGARLYERQPLVIVASQGARATDVAELARSVQERIEQTLKIKIEPEVRIIF